MSNRSWKRIILGVIFLLLSIFYTAIFYRQANFGNTMVFNIANLKGLDNILTSPINFNYWNHSGSQINLFSPWLTLLPGWLLVKLNVFWGFGVYLTAITFLTFVSAYFYMNKFSHDTFEAVLFSLIYTLSFNRFNLVFHEQRLENYIALIFLPMIYYGAYLFFKNKTWQTLTWGLVLTVWTSPYLAISVGLTLLPIYFLMIFSKRSHHWRYWGRLGLNSLIVLAFSVLATLGFIGPLINQQVGQNVQQSPIQNFDYISWFQDFNFSMMQLYLLMGIGVLLLLLLLLIFLKSRFSYKLIILEMIPIAAVVLVRWQSKGIDVSRLIMSLQTILDLFGIIIVSRIIILIFQEFPSVFKLLLLTATIAGTSYFFYTQAIQIQPKQTFSASQKVDYTKFVLDYHDHASNGKNEFLANGKKTTVSSFTRSSDYWVQYYSPVSTTLDLPVQNYAGYNVQLNNEQVAIKKSARKTLSIETHPGKNIIEIHTRYDLIGIVSLLLNLLGFIFLSYFSLHNLRWKMKKVPESS